LSKRYRIRCVEKPELLFWPSVPPVRNRRGPSAAYRTYGDALRVKQQIERSGDYPGLSFEVLRYVKHITEADMWVPVSYLDSGGAGSQYSSCLSAFESDGKPSYIYTPSGRHARRRALLKRRAVLK